MGQVLSVTDTTYYSGDNQIALQHTSPLILQQAIIKLRYSTPLHPYDNGNNQIAQCRHARSCVGRSGQMGVEVLPCI